MKDKIIIVSTIIITIMLYLLSTSVDDYGVAQLTQGKWIITAQGLEAIYGFPQPILAAIILLGAILIPLFTRLVNRTIEAEKQKIKNTATAHEQRLNEQINTKAKALQEKEDAFNAEKTKYDSAIIKAAQRVEALEAQLEDITRRHRNAAGAAERRRRKLERVEKNT